MWSLIYVLAWPPSGSSSLKMTSRLNGSARTEKNVMESHHPLPSTSSVAQDLPSLYPLANLGLWIQWFETLAISLLLQAQCQVKFSKRNKADLPILPR
jgi:hypothetical protein